MVKVYGNEISNGFTGGSSLVAIYTYGCKVWPETESWTGAWPGPEVHRGDYFIDWTPSDISGVFSIAGHNYYLEDYSGHFEDFDGVITSRAFVDNVELSTINTTAIKIDFRAFSGCDNIRNATMSHCSYIGFGAFAQCLNLSSISLPECTWIEDRAFYNDVALTAVSLPEVTYIGQSAFASCAHLGYVYLGPYCSMVASSAFHSVGYSLQGYTSYTLAYRGPGTVAVSGSLGNMRQLTVPAWKMELYSTWVSAAYLRSMFYVRYDDVDKEVFGVGVLTSSNISWGSSFPSYFETDAIGITSSAVYGQTNLTGVSLSQVRTIGFEAFSGCTNLEDFFAPNVMVIETRGLAGTKIPYGAFSVLSSIGVEAFLNCQSLSYLMLGWSGVCSLSNRGLSGCTSLQAIYVPASLVESYKTADYWSQYSDIIYPLVTN